MIGRSAVALLLAQPQTETSPFFFPADWGEGHFIGVVRVLDRVCALAGLADVTPHTLRHTFASVAGDLGFSELTIAALLGHASRGVTQRYVHINEALRMTADKVAGEIAAILDGAQADPAPPIAIPSLQPAFEQALPHDDGGRHLVSVLDAT